MNGWNEEVCLKCTDSNGAFIQKDNIILSQNPLNCDTGYVAKSGMSKTISFENGGSG